MPEQRPRILVVDDREQNRYVLCRILERAGYDCEMATNGKEALERVASLPDIAILDVHLPDLSGYDLCRRIKSNPQTAQVAVLQISASFVANEDKAKALEVGADGYLTHPIDGVVLIATIRSLLRLRRAEMVARESAAQWQSAFDSLSEGLACVDAEGKITRLNQAFAEICGLPCPCNRGTDAAELLQRVLGTSRPLLHEGTDPYSAEFQLGRRAVQVTINVISVDGVHDGKVIVLRDVTDRNLAEYAMRTADMLAATGKLAHAIAHEINNPLEALTNLIYLAQSQKSPADIQTYLASAGRELDRIGRITKQSLSFHRDTVHAIPVDVGSLMDEVVALYQKSAAARNVQIVVEQHPTLAIDAFPGQLMQVFGNLVRNALEAALPNTQVVIRVRSVSRLGRSGTKVTIHDRGPGIPHAVQERMFDPFFTTKELKGSGLGLWVSQALLSKHRGTLRFRSRTENGPTGTTFQVFLPVGGLEPGTSEPAP
jgi:two-component system, NtrC family, sensor kinase